MAPHQGLRAALTPSIPPRLARSQEEAKKGAFKRPATQFHDKISADGSTDYKAESGRYHLYVAWACPWAHRTLMTRALKGLEDAISVTMLGWRLEWPTDGRPYRGWPFTKEDPDPFHPEWEYLHDLYRSVDPDYPHKSITVPVLFDKKTKKIVNNESAEIIGVGRAGPGGRTAGSILGLTFPTPFPATPSDAEQRV